MKSTMIGRYYRDGDVMMRQGEMGDCMFVIQGGKVELLQRKADKEFCLGVLDEGDFFGESALFEQAVRSSTARALGDACVLSVSRRNFMQRMNEDPSFTLRLMQKMSRRVRELEAALIRVGDPGTVEVPANAEKP